MTNKYFYQDLESSSLFETKLDNTSFTPVPKDWLIIITDIKSSTQAIDSGKYRDVNMVGAASIVAAHNVINDLAFPYIFGGDGATMLIPPEYEQAMDRELSALQQLSSDTFKLDLRIGKITVKEILDAGGVINVAKHSLTATKSIACFSGGGLNIAEKKIKSDENQYCLRVKTSNSPNLEKLSCRWNPIPSQKGKILSLIILSREQSNTSIYHQILTQLQTFYSGDLDSANPVKQSQLSYKGFHECIQSEKKLHQTQLAPSFFKRLQTILVSVFIFKLGFFKSYKASISSHSDYRKFDDMLRMVIDCNTEQITLINQFLNKLYQQEKIYYGTHISKTALMTCFVNNLAESQHIHFIDGGNGGYAVAAKQLKEQIRKSEYS